MSLVGSLNDSCCFCTFAIAFWLVVLTILKNTVLVNGKDDIPYMKWQIKFMFETTNQHSFCGLLLLSHLVGVPLWLCNSGAALL